MTPHRGRPESGLASRLQKEGGIGNFFSVLIGDELMTMTQKIAAMFPAIALLLVPVAANGAHRYPQPQLQIATARLHDAADRLNQVAQHCSPTRTEQVFAGILLKKTCRLADGVRDGKSWGRVNGDYHSVRGFMKVIDNRIRRYCRSELDYRWRAAWANVHAEFANVCHIWDNREALCRQPACDVQPGFGISITTQPWNSRSNQLRIDPWGRTPYGGQNPYQRFDTRQPWQGSLPGQPSYQRQPLNQPQLHQQQLNQPQLYQRQLNQPQLNQPQTGRSRGFEVGRSTSGWRIQF